ncbi:MAG: hypothetical protein HY520_03900 [Candidatus Aenigmarchaeota archaeon]|nr:hypothetical protein [Candidatus Aenigmarchaeota archaeon]
MLSELPFGALLSYTPRPQTDDQKRSKDWNRALKLEWHVDTPPVPFSQWVAQRIRARLGSLPFRDCFGPEVTLVPVPSSALTREGTLWVPLNLARTLLAEGLAGQVTPCLVRTEALPKAATSAAAKRPKAADHYRTLRVQRDLAEPRDILLVDDVVTRGATMLGAASRLQEAFPGTRIRGFAAMRTISNPAEFEAIEAPCTGRITLLGSGGTLRRP